MSAPAVALLVLFMAISLGDIFTTERVFRRGGHEANPAMAWLMARLGRPKTYAIKLIVAAAIGTAMGLLGLFTVLQLLDVIITYRAMSRGDREGNPLALWMMKTFGRIGAAVANLLLVMARHNHAKAQDKRIEALEAALAALSA